MPPISSLSSILPLIDTSAPCSRDNRENGSYGSAGMSEVMAARCFTTADAPFCEDSRVGMRTCLGMLDVALGLQWIARLIPYTGLHCGLFVIFNTGKTLSPDRIFSTIEKYRQVIIIIIYKERTRSLQYFSFPSTCTHEVESSTRVLQVESHYLLLTTAT